MDRERLNAIIKWEQQSKQTRRYTIKGADFRAYSPEERVKMQELRTQDYFIAVKVLLEFGGIPSDILSQAQFEDLPELRDVMWQIVGDDPRDKVQTITQLARIAQENLFEERYPGTNFPNKGRNQVGQDNIDYRSTIWNAALSFLLPNPRRHNQKM